MTQIQVTFAPDWREGNPYQSLLASELEGLGVKVAFASGYRRVLPLFRGVVSAPSHILHLHWPEAYFRRSGRLGTLARMCRFPFDVRLTRRKAPLVVTAHNLFPHEYADSMLARRNAGIAFRMADAVIAHSQTAAQVVADVHGVSPAALHTVPHGDLSAALPPLVPRDCALARLNQPDEPMCLMFGRVDQYKGIEEVLEVWRAVDPPCRLAIVGQPQSPAFESRIRELASKSDKVTLALKFVGNDELMCWLSAASCVLFNYRAILTSGAASLARSIGVPIILPTRHDTIELEEPNERVMRVLNFDDELVPAILQAIRVGASFNSAAPWRESCSWQAVARRTLAVYSTILRARAG